MRWFSCPASAGSVFREDSSLAHGDIKQLGERKQLRVHCFLESSSVSEARVEGVTARWQAEQQGPGRTCAPVLRVPGLRPSLEDVAGPAWAPGPQPQEAELRPVCTCRPCARTYETVSDDLIPSSRSWGTCLPAA